MAISQEEIVSNAQTVTKGLEALRVEHQSMLGGIREQKKETTDNVPSTEDSVLSEKCALIEKSLEMIDLGLDEAHVMSALASHLQAVEAEKQVRTNGKAKIPTTYCRTVLHVKTFFRNFALR